MAASSTSSAYTIYNDKQMNTQYSEYNTKISAAEDKVTTWEDYYYSGISIGKDECTVIIVIWTFWIIVHINNRISMEAYGK